MLVRWLIYLLKYSIPMEFERMFKATLSNSFNA